MLKLYLLKENVIIDFSNYKNPEEAQYKIAEYIGIDKCTLNRILKRTQRCSRPIALLITLLNSKSDDISQFFEYIEEVK